uniref:Uncharacterized protein n=1 Tax=Spumella elongata TaxID=89044 RepID=A0A7S3MAL3_9STRA|mmetsp:Transcript_4598/g.7678  ORF Transcript_4598/g.7678 Transcript_4598/m.7678 type:complete len:106 (+) Transcript_4598:127-444(+)|eukprot:CAMPEP_0185002050 /NCGR_PEP_ID=MMETSP1098-20130426/72775_1 /TAXON_ID=89044 /ORGANISM="Spumella elongata, Strain CCAP 955/1" /LENGTH=105 /DNA_ID=CAMNT_0027529467 /DNA_START=121 /DNA_END=438 /DNA_ORIENTATION=+
MKVFIGAITLTVLYLLASASGSHHHHKENKIKEQTAPIITQPHMWASLEGINFLDAEEKIKSDRPELEVVKLNQIYEGTFHDYKDDRVRVFVDDHDSVVGFPTVG